MQETHHPRPRHGRDRNPPELGTVQRHELPAKLAHVTRVIRLITPAAASVLRVNRVLQGPLEAGQQPLVAG